ncbi:MAG: MazG nucleotide pyrophosphohydrolase domain-containing protein [Patescibacteria group bacterium]|nr:MazG nucleotide pyrophosphohydrolase domain-containing protein [Patescibacteria group bacterium]
MKKERGFDKESLAEAFMLLMEECGELVKAARKTQGIKCDSRSKEYRLDHEAADVFMYLLAICNTCSIDLEQAFRDKEEINKLRTWR